MGFKYFFKKRNSISEKEEELKAHDKAIKIKPDDYKAWYKKGNVLNDMGLREEALKAYEKAIEIKLDYHNAWNNKGNVLKDLGRKDEALKAYGKAIEIKPDFHNAWKNKGSVLNDLGRRKDALKACEKAIEIKPDFQNAWKNKGNVLRDLGRMEDALKAYEKAIEIKHDYFEAWYNKGNVLFDLKKYEDAIKCYNKVKELESETRNFEEILTDVDAKYREASREILILEIEDMRRSAFYCGALFIVHLKHGELETAYKYASDLLDYSHGEAKDITTELCAQLEERIDNGIYDVPDELMKKAEIITYKVALGFSVISNPENAKKDVKARKLPEKFEDELGH